MTSKELLKMFNKYAMRDIGVDKFEQWELDDMDDELRDGVHPAWLIMDHVDGGLYSIQDIVEFAIDVTEITTNRGRA